MNVTEEFELCRQISAHKNEQLQKAQQLKGEKKQGEIKEKSSSITQTLNKCQVFNRGKK